MANSKLQGLIIVVCLAWSCLAFGQTPGLVGPFVPIDVENTTASETETTADFTAFTYYEPDVPVYYTENISFTPSEMIDVCQNTIGTDIQAQNVAVINDRWPANTSETGCDVQQDYPEIYDNDGNCFEAVSSFISPGSSTIVSLIECQSMVKAFIDAQDPMVYPTIAYSGFTCTNEGTSFTAGRARIAFNVTGYFTSPVARFDVEGDYYCDDAEEPIPDESDPTDDEIYQELRPNISNEWFLTSDNDVINDNDTINTWTTNVTTNYNSYSNSWMTGQPLLPPNYNPVTRGGPANDGDTGQGGGLDCDENGGVLACEDTDSFLDDLQGMIDGLFGTESDYPDVELEVTEEDFAVPGIEEIAPVTELGSCPANQVLDLGVVDFEITYDTWCGQLSTFVYPLVMALSALTAAYIVLGRS